MSLRTIRCNWTIVLVIAGFSPVSGLFMVSHYIWFSPIITDSDTIYGISLFLVSPVNYKLLPCSVEQRYHVK